MRTLVTIRYQRSSQVARRKVVEVVCDRCKKPDLQEEQDLQEEAELDVTFRGKKISYKDLCRRCREAVQGYFMRMTKQEEDKKDAAAPAVPALAAVPAPVEKKSLFGR